MKPQDVIDLVTSRIIEDLEKGTAPWVKPWTGGLTLPKNASSKKFYSGINTLFLWSVASAKGYTSNQWLTFKQAQALGGRVRKGEKATPVIFFRTLTIEDKSTGEEEKIPLMKSYSAFNLDQIDGLDHLKESATDLVRTEIERLESAERLLSKSGARIEVGGASACFIPSLDLIRMPPRETFKDQRGFYGTALHELTHWTGHESRLNRLKPGRECYAFEELVAELGASYLCAYSGLPYDTQHASYIASWLKALRDDRKLIFKAAAAANRAFSMILGLAGESLNAESEDVKTEQNESKQTEAVA